MLIDNFVFYELPVSRHKEFQDTFEHPGLTHSLRLSYNLFSAYIKFHEIVKFL